MRDTPVDIKASRLQRKAMSLPEVLEDINSRRVALNVTIIDACRIHVASTRAGGPQNFALKEAPALENGGSIIAFSTKTGKVAYDNDGKGGATRNGLYTQHLLRHLVKPVLRLIKLRTPADQYRTMCKENRQIILVSSR